MADLSDAPYALTTHLMSHNSPQFHRATQPSFLAHAAKGTLPKPLLAQWLANDRVYLENYISFTTHLLQLLHSTTPNAILTSKDDPSVEQKLTDWLELALQNIQREENFFLDVAHTYDLDVQWITPTSSSSETPKSKGLLRFETLFAQTSRQKEPAFLPWLEGALLLWATEKVYHEAFSWAREQNLQTDAQTYDADQDGGAMRKELIPNWSSDEFRAFVQTLERIVNEGVGCAVDGEDARWVDVKERSHVIWEALLEAEEAFWPDVEALTEGSSAA